MPALLGRRRIRIGRVGLAGAIVLLAAACVPTPYDPPPGQGPLVALATTNVALQPAFDPGVHDYVMHCGANNTRFRLSFTAAPGGTAQVVAPLATAPASSDNPRIVLAENQAVVVRDRGGSDRGLLDPVPPTRLPRDPGHPSDGTDVAGLVHHGERRARGPRRRLPMILDGNGTPVWYRRSPGGAFAAQVGPTLISFGHIAGPGFNIDPSAKYQIYDLATRTTTTIGTVGAPLDLHDIQRLANGNYLLESYPLVRGVDLTGLQTFGPGSTIADCMVQEVTPAGAPVWTWRATDHFPPAQSSTFPSLVKVAGEDVVDVYHCNSLDADAQGHVLVSARHMDSVFEVSRATGAVLWKLGGTAANTDGAQILGLVGDGEGGFFRQHDARFLPNGHISMFDNHTGEPSGARGVEYALDLNAGTATQVFQFRATANSGFMGSFRRNSDGTSVIGWGGLNDNSFRFLTEIDAAGRDLLDMRFPSGTLAYRAVKVPPATFDVTMFARDRRAPVTAVTRRSRRGAQAVRTGSESQPRTVEVRACTAWSQSTSHSGKRWSTSSSATRPSSRASAAPRQKWMP